MTDGGIGRSMWSVSLLQEVLIHTRLQGLGDANRPGEPLVAGFARAGWLALCLLLTTARAAEPVRLNPVLDRFADAVTFYHDFEHGGLAVMSAGEGEPFDQVLNRAGKREKRPPILAVEGIRGQSLQAGAWKYRAAGNLDLVRPGALWFWIRAVNWRRSRNEPTFCPLMIGAENGNILLGRQGLIVQDGVLKRGDTFFLQARNPKNKLIGNLTNFTGSKGWSNELHLVALTWRPGRLAWSFDGGAFSSGKLSEPLGQAGWFQIGVDWPMPPGQEIIIDEWMILNRELSDDEVQWLFTHF